MKPNTNLTKKALLVIFVMLLPLLANAEKVQIDGIWYNLIEKAKQAEVAHNDEAYTDSIFIVPATVMYNGNIYDVISVERLGLKSPFPISIILSEGIMRIGDSAFSCADIKDIVIPKSVVSIGGHAFFNCVSLISITIPDGVKNIGDYAFWSCEGLTSIILPQSLESIGNSSFMGCTKLESIYIPNRINRIEKSTFKDCSSLKEVKLSNSVSAIEEEAFYDCTNLSSIVMPNIHRIESSAFWNCINLKSVDFPESIFTIGSFAFYGCANITSIIIPKHVDSIGWSAFENCDSLSSIIFMGSPKLEKFAFSDCSQLLDVFCCSEEKCVSAETDAFMNSGTKYATLHTPPTRVMWYYENWEPWSKFGKIVPLTEEDLEQIYGRSQKEFPIFILPIILVFILVIISIAMKAKKKS